jgi:hypothetical protein
MSNISAPRLPNSTVEYNQNYINELTNILRLYFNQINSAVNRLSTPVTVDQLSSAVVSGVGARRFVIDSSVSTFGTTVAGGGSNKVPVYSDGTNWKVG